MLFSSIDSGTNKALTLYKNAFDTLSPIFESLWKESTFKVH
jgi:hypothetical protein